MPRDAGQSGIAKVDLRHDRAFLRGGSGTATPVRARGYDTSCRDRFFCHGTPKGVAAMLVGSLMGESPISYIRRRSG
jgi:hypothetical protein